MKYCPSCGALIRPNEKYCGTCSAPFPWAFQDVSPAGANASQPGLAQSVAASSTAMRGGYAPLPQESPKLYPGHVPTSVSPTANTPPIGVPSAHASYAQPAVSIAQGVRPDMGLADIGIAPTVQPPAPSGQVLSQNVPAEQPYGPPPVPSKEPVVQAPCTRCTYGHDVPFGSSYCAFGHPIALGDMRLVAADAFGATAYSEGVTPASAMQPTGAMSPYHVAPAVQQALPPPGANTPPLAVNAVPAYAAPFAPPAAAPYQASVVQETSAQAPRVLRAFLYSFHNDSSGAFWPIYTGRTIVGRAGSGEQLDIEINDPTTSSRHALVVIEGFSSVILEDACSTNGTFVNDQPIGYQGKVEIRDGDRIRFGGYNASIRLLSR